MQSRILPVVCVALLAISCGGEPADDEMATDAAAESAGEDAAVSADEAAIDALRLDYVQHYNMHHASVVADLYADSAVWMGANGSVLEGRDQILASLEAEMGGTPTLNISTRELMVFGDHAVAIGDYDVQTTAPDVGAVSVAGHHLALFNRVDGQWKINAVVTNYNAEPPDGLPAMMYEGDAPPEDGTMTELVTAYETHFNLGHADMVADLFTDDAVAAFGNLPLSQGRAAAEAALQQRIAMGDSPQVDIHDVYTMELGDGWAIDAGWYEITATGEAGPVGQSGTYVNLVRRQADGSWKIHWLVSNGQPTGG
jgi:uncharacterized protein (TIGR02246 family)